MKGSQRKWSSLGTTTAAFIAGAVLVYAALVGRDPGLPSETARDVGTAGREAPKPGSHVGGAGSTSSGSAARKDPSDRGASEIEEHSLEVLLREYRTAVSQEVDPSYDAPAVDNVADLLRRLADCEPDCAIENLRDAMLLTEESMVGCKAMAIAGALVSDLIAADPSLALAVHDNFMNDPSPSVKTMFAYSLFPLSGMPASETNLVAGLEYSMLAIIRETDHTTLRTALLYNLSRARNYDVLDEAMELAVRSYPAGQVLHFMKTIEISEEKWRMSASPGESDGPPRDSRDAHLDIIHQLATRRGASDQDLIDILFGLESSGRLDFMRRIRDDIDPLAFSPRTLEFVDSYLARLEGANN